MKAWRPAGFAIMLVAAVALACGGGGSGSGTIDPCSASGTAAPATALADFLPGLVFMQPVALLQHPIDESRWYVVEQGGLVYTASTITNTASVFIDISDRVTAGGEAGLLGMAFHPEFDSNRLIFLSYTGPGTPLVSIVASFQAGADSLSADPDSENILFSLDQPFTNHNGGGIAFGPDGYFYIGLGDGGSGGDPDGNGQNPATLLGSILRIDVDQSDLMRGKAYSIPADNPFSENLDCSEGGCPEIYAYGFRNPWRWSFDMLTGDLWIGDVGQNSWEEIDRVDVSAGRNYGWNIMEGRHCFNAASCDTTGLTLPVAEYDHSLGISVTGGYVYRGTSLPGLTGDYIFGDFGSGRIWRIIDADQGCTQTEVLVESNLNIASFGQDRSGEIYVVSYGDGRIYKLVP